MAFTWGLGVRSRAYLNPRVCRIVAFWAGFRCFWAMTLPTFGVQVADSIGLPAAGLGVAGLEFFQAHLSHSLNC